MRFKSAVSLLAGVVCLHAAGARAASLADLYAAVPPPPQSVEAALSWMQDGHYVNADYLRFKQALEAEKAEIAALNGGQFPRAGAPPSPDIADRGEVKRAIRAYDSYLAMNSGQSAPELALAKRTRWIQRAMGVQQLNVAKAMQPCNAPCKDPSEIAANARPLAERDRLLAQELELWDTLFQDWHEKRADKLSVAQDILAAAGNGAVAETPQGKAAIAEYRAAMVKEVELALSITELAVRRAAAIEAGLENAPDSISGATPKQK